MTPSRLALLFATSLCTIGCTASRSSVGGSTDSTEPVVHADVQSLEWLRGRWASADGLSVEEWTAAGDALFGVGFTAFHAAFARWLLAGVDRCARPRPSQPSIRSVASNRTVLS